MVRPLPLAQGPGGRLLVAVQWDGDGTAAFGEADEVPAVGVAEPGKRRPRLHGAGPAQVGEADNGLIVGRVVPRDVQARAAARVEVELVAVVEPFLERDLTGFGV